MVEQIHDAPHQQRAGDSPAWIIGLFVFALAVIAFGIFFNITQTTQANTAQLWKSLLGLLATLGIFSILYKENPLFSFFEHIFIGLAVGYGIVATWVLVAQPKWLVPMLPATWIPGGGGKWAYIFALLIGLLFFTVYFPKLSWMNRFALGIYMGWVAGNALQQFIGVLGPQIVAAFRPPITSYAPSGMGHDLNNIHSSSGWLQNFWFHPWSLVALIVLLCTLSYFFFSIDHKKAGWIQKPANLGRYFLMITLGAIFGTTVMGRFSLVIERFDNVIRTVGDWWHAFVK